MCSAYDCTYYLLWNLKQWGYLSRMKLVGSKKVSYYYGWQTLKEYMEKIVMWCKIFADFEISVSQCRSSGFRSSRMWCCAVGWVVRLLDPWRWKHHDPSKHCEPCTPWCNIMSEKTWILESKWLSVSFLLSYHTLVNCVILCLCTCCNKYVTPLHGLKITVCLYMICH